MAAIFESKTLGPTERLVMLSLADHADDSGKCYPSIQRICERTGLSERAVQTNVKKLTDTGYLRVLHGGGKGKANLYFLSANPAADAPYGTSNPAYAAPRTKCTPAADAPQTPQQMRSNPAADAPEPSGTVIGGGGVAREAEKTDREAILEAIGVDPVSGITGPRGKQLGTQADMAEVARWLDLPGITVPVILTEVRRIMAGKRDGPPSTFRFFTKAIQRLSGEISRPALDPITPQPTNGGRHDRQRFDQTINAIADGLSAGTVQLDTQSRDPFAARPGGNA